MSDKTQTAQRAAQSGLDGFFKISERGSTVGQEVRGGLVTFLTMAYIIVLNPLILGFVPDSTGAFLGGGAEPGSGIPAIAAGTALVAGVLTILMGGRRQLPAGAGHRPGPQRLRRLLHRPADDLGATRWAWWSSRASSSWCWC